MSTKKAVTKKATKKVAANDNVIVVEFTEQEENNPALKEGRVEDYEVNEKEKDYVHVELEKTEFDRSSGKKKSKPMIQKFDPRGWNNFRGQAKKLGFIHVRVLYAPEGTNTEVLDPIKAETTMGKK